ncbi:hypothetical protein L218DRAFT_886135, partial [Marasmius fiardii PR-910]
IGHVCFSAAIADSTGNTHSSKHDLAKIIPTLLPLADICHHLSNTSKDIVNIKYFAEVYKLILGFQCVFFISFKPM